MKIYDEEETIISRPLTRTTPNVATTVTHHAAPSGSEHDGAHNDTPQVSIFLPVYNEEESLTPLHIKIDAALATLKRTVEVIYVDDGSTDGTFDVLREIEKRDPRVRVISFRRNYGKMAAMVAAIDAARGRTLVALDADLQNDPADIERLLAKLEEGFDVVSGWRVNRQDKQWTRRVPSLLANRLISWASGVNLHDYGCCLKAYRREVLQDVQFYGEMHRFIPIYAAHQAGARVAELPVLHHPRVAGVSKFGKLTRTFEVVLDLITIKYMEDYRTKPMHLFGYVGFFSFGIAAFALLLSVLLKFSGTGFFQTPLITIFFLGLAFGVQFILLGLLSETLMRTYYESQRKPTYTVREYIGFDTGARATSDGASVTVKETVAASA